MQLTFDLNSDSFIKMFGFLFPINWFKIFVHLIAIKLVKCKNLKIFVKIKLKIKLKLFVNNWQKILLIFGFDSN